MIEIERQVSESPDVCVIIQGDPVTGRVRVERFEDEAGEVIAENGTVLFGVLLHEYGDEITGAMEDCRDEMRGWFEDTE